MIPAYYNPAPYPPAPWPPQPAQQPPAKPRKPWPLDVVNRRMTFGLGGLTLLAMLLAVLAPLVAQKPSTAGMTLAYQWSLTQDDGNWDTNANCVFTSAGYVVTAPDADHAAYCALQKQDLQNLSNFTMRVRIADISQYAAIEFLSNYRLAIFGSGRFLLYEKDDLNAAPTYLIPPSNAAGAGSAALHPNELGTSEWANEITIQVQDLTYSFYANGQLLATYNAPAQANPGPITLIALGGSQATFSNIALYTPGASS
jgi:hypothetical protein